MRTYERICKENLKIYAPNKVLILNKGEKYLTSRSRNREVMVLTKYWVNVPTNKFGKPKRFT
jgi:hypothetical protein